LNSDEAKTLSRDNFSSSSFWKRILPPYHETIDIDDNSIASPDSFQSIEDDGERDGNQSSQDDMILSNSIEYIINKCSIAKSVSINIGTSDFGKSSEYYYIIILLNSK
jgi:hypothetical protein